MFSLDVTVGVSNGEFLLSVRYECRYVQSIDLVLRALNSQVDHFIGELFETLQI
jgi:hypothetical protein